MGCLEVIVPSLVSVVGFIITIILNKLNVKREVSKRLLEQYWDNYKSIEYDVTEILQLILKQHLETPAIFPYDIYEHRSGEFAKSSNVAERIYRLTGYVSTYGSIKTMRMYNELKKFYNDYFLDIEYKDSEIENDNIIQLLSMLAVFLSYIKKDIINNKRDKIGIIAKLWIELRLPVSFFNKYKDDLENKINELLSS